MLALLLALYPKAWRERYGQEYEALLEDTLNDTGMSVATVFDIAKAACSLRLMAHQRNLSVLVATGLYTLSGVTCIRLGLTDNWPIWAPASPLKAAGLLLTLAPLAFALYTRLSILREYKQQWHGSNAVFWSVATPITVLSTLVLAFICSCILMSTGIFGMHGGVAFVCGVLSMAGVSLGFMKFLNLLQTKLLIRLAIR